MHARLGIHSVSLPCSHSVNERGVMVIQGSSAVSRSGPSRDGGDNGNGNEHPRTAQSHLSVLLAVLIRRFLGRDFDRLVGKQIAQLSLHLPDLINLLRDPRE